MISVTLIRQLSQTKYGNFCAHCLGHKSINNSIYIITSLPVQSLFCEFLTILTVSALKQPKMLRTQHE